jgi:CRISPR-associated Csx3 family protein
MERRVIDLSAIHGGQAKLSELPRYAEAAREAAGLGNEVVLTGAAPVWMYLFIAHALHGKAMVLKYLSPATGEVIIFDHNPY